MSAARTQLGGDPDRLLSLLPAHLRTRDEQSGGVLRALLSAVAGELELLEQDLVGLYDGWFVETCDEELLPYVADLIGMAEALPDLGGGTSWRPVVANTISYRRRKGTVAVLEQVAREVTGWQARAVEYYRLLATATHVNHPRRDRPAVASLRQADRLDRTGGGHDLRTDRVNPPPEVHDLTHGAFEPLAHSVDVRRIGTGRGRYGIAQVGIFLFPLHSCQVGTAEAVDRWPQARHIGGGWTFDPLGRPTPLFPSVPRERGAQERLASEDELPVPLRPRGLRALLEEARNGVLDPRHLPLGVRIGRDGDPLPPERLRVSCLEGLEPGKGDQVCVDAAAGRLTVYRDGTPLTSAEVFVRYHHGRLAEVGAGSYDRSEGLRRALAADGYGDEGIARRVDVRSHPGPLSPADSFSLAEALAAVEGSQPPDGSPSEHTVVVAIGDSASHVGDLTVTIPEGTRLVLVAASAPHRVPASKSAGLSIGTACVTEGVRPHLHGSLTVTGGPGSSLVLDGITIEGDVTVSAGRLTRLTVSQCTVAGGVTVARDAPRAPAGTDSALRVSLFRSVVKAVELPRSVPTLVISDSIVDAGSAGPAVSAPGAHLSISGSTVRGDLQVRGIDADSALLDGLLVAENRQAGCLRYTYLRPGSRAPRRFRCVPSSAADSDLAPVYASEEPGSPLYLSLAHTCPTTISEGGEGGAEMGAHHHLHRPQRRDALRRHLAPYVPAELEFRIIGS
ncbi:phage tail protein [Streptomyces sp. TX20-6-3]|uniref:phage tail protein n=1 Tax=Streptomyces sp. TX20-6-3 TaxID=3028705 RepID=UPI0029A0492E|nr:phage tail protein [Streptomyces sp. TX20-6-3]MDX2562918.1 phage tail protein [Streptomyces sp. TX20-6-3]